MKRLVIDTELCTGHARCVTLAPELFTDDESGYGHVIGDVEFTDELRSSARRAISACPERAISLVDD